MNTPTRLVAVALATITPVTAAPLLTLGDSLDVFFNGSAGVLYVDNLFYTDDSVVPSDSDTILVLRPGLEFRFGNAGTPAKATFFVEDEIKQYSDRTDLDEDNIALRGEFEYSTARTQVGLDAEWYETDQSTADIRLNGGLVEREITRVAGRAEHELSGKTSLAAGFGFYEVQFRNGLYTDHESYTLPVDFYYGYSPKLDLSVNYQYRKTEVANGTNSADHFVGVGARGELAPKVNGSVRMGTVRRDPSVGPSDNTLAIDTDLSWAASPKSTVRLTLSRDFGTSAAGSSTRNTRLGFDANYQFSPFIVGGLYGSYETSSYSGGREDDTLFSGFNVSYVPNAMLRFSAGYTYQQNDSNVAGLSYETHILNFTASLRY